MVLDGSGWYWMVMGCPPVVEFQPTNRIQSRVSTWAFRLEVPEFRREDIEVGEEDLVEFSTDGILTDINLAGTTADEELGPTQKVICFLLLAESWATPGNARFHALSLSLAHKAASKVFESLR